MAMDWSSDVQRVGPYEVLSSNTVVLGLCKAALSKEHSANGKSVSRSEFSRKKIESEKIAYIYLSILQIIHRKIFRDTPITF